MLNAIQCTVRWGFLVALTIGSAGAQTVHSLYGGPFYFQNQIVWTGPTKGVELQKFGQGAAIFALGKEDLEVRFPASVKILGVTEEGKFLAIRRRSAEIDPELLEGDSEGRFKPIGTFNTTADHLPPFDFMLPLESPGKFLGANTSPGFAQGNQGSYFGIFQRDALGVLTLKELLELPVGPGPAFQVDRSDPAHPSVIPNPAYQAILPFLTVPVQTKDWVVLVSVRSGMMWVVDRATGRIRKTLSLYKTSPGLLSDRSEVEQAILSIQPLAEGKLLIAARDEYSYLHSATFFKYRKPPEGLTPALGEASADLQIHDAELREREAERALETFGEIAWWEVDLEEGKILPSQIHGLPPKVRALGQLRKFSISLRPGQIITTLGMVSLPTMPIAQAPTQGGSPRP